MHEPLLERIRDLERAVTRWRLISLALFILLISGTAISCTFGVIVMLSDHRDMLHAEMMAREQAEVARMEADRARMDAELARQRVEELRREADADARNGVNP
jgi:hypothetical protein